MMTGSPTPVGPGTRQGSQIAAVVDSSILHQLSACGPSCSNSSTAPSACPTFGSDFWIDNPGDCQVSQSFWDVDLITLHVASNSQYASVLQHSGAAYGLQSGSAAISSTAIQSESHGEHMHWCTDDFNHCGLGDNSSAAPSFCLK